MLISLLTLSLWYARILLGLLARIFNRIAKLIGGYIKDSKSFTIFNLKTLANFN